MGSEEAVYGSAEAVMRQSKRSSFARCPRWRDETARSWGTRRLGLCDGGEVLYGALFHSLVEDADGVVFEVGGVAVVL